MEQLWLPNLIPAYMALLFTFVFLSPVFHTNAHIWRRQATDGPGTTENIEAIFKGRCHEHVQCLQSDRCNRPGKTVVNCNEAWTQFLGVFQHIKPCNTSADAYDEVLKTIKPITPKDETLFWSGLLDAALNVARVSEHFRILEESLPGYIANNLNWCGDPDPSSGGVNYTKCPTSYDCDGETGFAFWRAASREFSKQAKGKVTVALNAHREGGAFRNTSVFATVELPNLDPKNVNMVDILLVPDIKLPINKSEKCGEGSILVLQHLIEQRGMTWTCTFDPVEFRFIQCTTLDDPEKYDACKVKKNYVTFITWIFIGVCCGLLLLIVIVAIILCAKCRRGFAPNRRHGTNAV